MDVLSNAIRSVYHKDASITNSRAEEEKHTLNNCNTCDDVVKDESSGRVSRLLAESSYESMSVKTLPLGEELIGCISAETVSECSLY